jgi:hypothetical protein
MDTRISALQRDLHRAANSANVSIYTLDPMPESEHRSMPIDIQVGGPNLADLMNSAAVQTSLDGLKDALWDAAAETGGQASIGATSLDTALQRIDDDTSRFYLLSYAPPAPHGDGEYHAIRVEVRRPGVTVRGRNGYVDLPADERISRALAAALVLPGSVDALPVDVRALNGWSRDGDPVVKLVVGLTQDLAQQQSGPPAMVSHRIHAVALDVYGATVDEVNQQMQLSGPPTDKILSGERPAVYVHEWALPAGSFDLRVAVRDSASGELGAASLDVDVPEPSSSWRASDLMLAVADENGIAQPLLNPWIYPDEPLFAYVEVSGGVEPALSGYLLDPSGTERLGPLPVTSLARDAAGIHRGALRLRNLLPGDYVLEVVLRDPGAHQSKSFRAPLQVLEF